jgi:hypothetical protein
MSDALKITASHLARVAIVYTPTLREGERIACQTG